MQEKTKAKARVVASESSQLPSLDFGIKSTKKQEVFYKLINPIVKTDNHKRHHLLFFNEI